jgi:hypothetical protein
MQTPRLCWVLVFIKGEFRAYRAHSSLAEEPRKHTLRAPLEVRLTLQGEGAPVIIISVHFGSSKSAAPRRRRPDATCVRAAATRNPSGARLPLRLHGDPAAAVRNQVSPSMSPAVAKTLSVQKCRASLRGALYKSITHVLIKLTRGFRLALQRRAQEERVPLEQPAAHVGADQQRDAGHAAHAPPPRCAEPAGARARAPNTP